MAEINDAASFALLADEAGFDPIEDRLRANVRATIEAMFEVEPEAFIGRCRYGRRDGVQKGCRHGHPKGRSLAPPAPKRCGFCAPRSKNLSVKRSIREIDRRENAGKDTEWRNTVLPRCWRLTRKAEALIAAAYLAEANTRRVTRALFGLFEGAASKE